MTGPALPEEVDVAIIGAGIVGASVFYELATAGKSLRIACFDKSHKLHGSTARSAAAFRHQFSSVTNVQCSLIASRELDAFPERFGTPPVIKRNGYCFVYRDAALFDAAARRADHQRGLGVPDLEVLDARETKRKFPELNAEGLAGSTFCRHDGFVFPDQVTNAYFAAGEREGACLRQYRAVIGIEREAGRVSGVRVEGDAFVRASVVVNAAGPWAGMVSERCAGLQIPLVPLKRYLYFTHQFERRDVSGFPLFVLDLEAYCRPEANGLMLGWDLKPEKPEGWNRFPSPPLPKRLESDLIEPGFGTGGEDFGIEVLSEIADYLPFLEEEGGLQSVTAGYYEISPDEKAIVSWDPRLEGLLHATGFSGHGVMHAPATAKLVRALILGEDPPVDPEAFALGPLLANEPRKDPELMVI